LDPASTVEYEITFRFETVNLPPVTDILVLGKRYPHGKHGVLMAFQYIAPDEFVFIDLPEEHPSVEAILASKKILRRIPQNHLMDLLERHVYPFINEDEAIKVDLNVILHSKQIKGEFKT